MTSILKVDQLQDSGGNAIITSNGAGSITTSSALNTAITNAGFITSGGRSTLLTTTTISSAVSYFDMTDIMTNAYNNYLLVFYGMKVSTDGTDIRVTFFTGSGTGGHIASSGNYKYAFKQIKTDGTESLGASTTDAFYRPNNNGIGNGGNETANGQLQFFDMRNTTKRLLYGEVHSIDTSNNFVSSRSVCGSDFGDTAVTGLRFEVASGNINAGTFKLYGQE